MTWIKRLNMTPKHMQPKEKKQKTWISSKLLCFKRHQRKMRKQKASYERKKYLQITCLMRPDPRTQACLEDAAVPVQATATERVSQRGESWPFCWGARKNHKPVERSGAKRTEVRGARPPRPLTGSDQQRPSSKCAEDVNGHAHKQDVWIRLLRRCSASRIVIETQKETT